MVALSNCEANENIMKKTTKRSPSSSTNSSRRPASTDKQLDAKKLAAVTGGWGGGLGHGI